MNKFMTALIASVLLIAAGTVMAGGYGEQGKRGMHQRGDCTGSMMGEQFSRELQQLDLSDEQKANVKSVMQDLRTQSKSIGDEMRSNKMQLRAVIKAGTWDESAAAELAAKEGDLTAQRTLLISKAMAGIYAQLTDDQRAELEAKAEERMERRGQWREKRQGRQADKE